MKNVLALMGSPRKDKNTDNLLDAFLDGLDRDEFIINKIYLTDLDIRHCTGCDYCSETGNCSKNDDMDMLYEKFDSSQILVLAAPIYFNSVNGLTKSMIDRCQRYWALKYALGQDYKRNEDRMGVFLSVGGAAFTHDQFNGAISVMDFFFRAINMKYKGNYFVSNTDKHSVSERGNISEELREISKYLLNNESFYLHR